MAYATIIIEKEKWCDETHRVVKDGAHIFKLDWEQMLEIFKEFSTEEAQARFNGNECWKSAMIKAKAIFDVLPQGTDY